MKTASTTAPAIARTERRALPRLARLYVRAAMKDMGLKGRPKPSQLIAAEEVVVRAAYHEAAHAVLVAHLLYEFCELITIERGSENLSPGWGFTRRRSVPVFYFEAGALRNVLKNPKFRKAHREFAEREVMQNLAGIVVEVAREKTSGPFELEDALDQSHQAGDSDVEAALHVLSHFERQPERRWTWMFELAEEAAELVARPPLAKSIERIAEALLDTPTLMGSRLEHLLETVPQARSLMSRAPR